MAGASSDILIFDRARVRLNRIRALSRIDSHNFLIQWAQDQIMDRLNDIRRDFPIAVLLGTRSGQLLSEQLTKSEKIGALVGMDMAGTPSNNFKVCADEEFLPFKDNSLDLVLSILGLHSTNDLPGCLIQVNRALKPDGLFLGALFGGETLMELRQSLMAAEIELRGGASPRVFPFADKPQMGALLQRAGFALPVVDSDIVTVTYSDMFSLLKDLRYMGEGNAILARDKHYVGKEFFLKAAEYYQRNFSENNGRIRATFEIIFVIGWAPHESQQKALQPGSAQVRLAHVLNTTEIKM